jgi:hypothetical protein
MLAYVVQPKAEEIRRLEVQAHLGPEGEDDLCPPSMFEDRYGGLMTQMALFGVLPSEDPPVVRVAVAVDVLYRDAQEGWGRWRRCDSLGGQGVVRGVARAAGVHDRRGEVGS